MRAVARVRVQGIEEAISEKVEAGTDDQERLDSLDYGNKVSSSDWGTNHADLLSRILVTETWSTQENEINAYHVGQKSYTRCSAISTINGLEHDRAEVKGTDEAESNSKSEDVDKGDGGIEQNLERNELRRANEWEASLVSLKY